MAAATVQAPEVDEEEPNPSPSPEPSPSTPSPPPVTGDAITQAQQTISVPPIIQHQKDLAATTLAPTEETPQQQPSQDETPPELKQQQPLGKAPPELINDLASKNDKAKIHDLYNSGQIDKDTAREALKAQVNLKKEPVQAASDALVNAVTSTGQAIGGAAKTTWQAATDWSPTNPLYQFASQIGDAGNEIRILSGPEMQNQPVAGDLQDRLNVAKKNELANVPPELPDAQQGIQEKYAVQQTLVDQIRQLEQKNGYGEQSADKAQELARMTAINALDPNYLSTRKQEAIHNLTSGGLLATVELGQGAYNITKYTAAGPLLDLAQHLADSKKSDAQWDKDLDTQKGIYDWTNQLKAGKLALPTEKPLTAAAGFAENPFGIGPKGESTTGLPYMSPEQLAAKGEISPEKIEAVSQTGQLAALTALPELGLGEAIEGATTGLLRTGEAAAKGTASTIKVATNAAGQTVKKFGALEAMQSLPELITRVAGGGAVGGAVHGPMGAAIGGIGAGVHYLLGKTVAPLATYAAAKQVQRILEFTGNAFGKAAADSYSGKGILSNLAGWGLRQGTEGALGIAPFAAANAQTPEEFGSNLALGSLMHIGARAPGDLYGATAGPYFDSLFRSVPTKGVPTQPPVAYGTLPAADALTAKLADTLPADQKQKFTAVQNLMKGQTEVHLVPPQLYPGYFKFFSPTGELPDSNGFWISPEENTRYPGQGMSFIRSDRVPEALIHEGMGHPIYYSLPDDVKTVINRASLDPINQDINAWTENYFNQFGDPKLKGINYDSLPTKAEVDSGDPVATAKASSALGYTKDDIMAERGAELLSKVMDGVPIDKLTSDPGAARSLKYGIGKMFEFWGIPTVTPRSQSILGVNPSLSGALALEDYMRNYARGKQPAQPGTPPTQGTAPVPKPAAPTTPPDVTNRQFDAIASGVAGTGTTQTPVTNLGTPNVPTPQPQKQQPQTPATKEEVPSTGLPTETPTVTPPAAEIPKGEIPETRKTGALSQEERGVVYNRIMRREGPSDNQGGQPEVYGFRSGDDSEAYRAITQARAQYGQGSPQELEVVHKYLEAEATQAGVDKFNDPGIQSVVASMAHMRGPQGASAILNASIDGKIEQTATLKPETIEALNGMTPEEAQARIRQAREEYDRRVFGHTTTTHGGRTGNWWDTYGHGLLNRYNQEANEALAMSKGDPDAYREELDAHRTFTGPTESAGEAPRAPRELAGTPITPPEEIVNAKRAIQAQTPTDDELARLAGTGNKSAEEILRDNYGANWLSKVSQDVRNEYGKAYPEESTRQNVGIIGQQDTGNRVLGEQAKVLQAIQEQGGLPSAKAVSRTGTYLEPNVEDLRDLHEQFSRLTDQEKQYLKNNFGITPQKLFQNKAPTSEQVNANLTRQGVSNFGTPNDLFNHVYDTLSNLRQVMAGRPVLRQENVPYGALPRGSSTITSPNEGQMPALRERSGTQPSVVQPVQGRSYEVMAPNPSAHTGTEAEAQLPELLQGIYEARQTPQGTVFDLRESRQPNAPSRLLQTPDGRLVVPGSPSGATSYRAREHRVTQEDLIAAGNQAKANVPTKTANGKDRTGTVAYQNEVNAAAMEAMLERHAAGLGPEDTQMRLYRDPDDPKKLAATGTHIDPNDPMNQILTAGIPQHDIGTANRFGQAINSRTPLHITHYSAERSLLPEDSRRASIRRQEQETSPAGERAMGAAPGESLTKTIIPTRLEIGGLKSANRTVLLRGISPDKLADNFRKIQERLPANHAAKNMRPEEIAQALRNYIDNHRAGYKGDGSAPIKGKEVDPTYHPKEMPKQVADAINMALGDTGARANTERGSRARQASQENEGFLNPATGEVNPLREKLDKDALAAGKSIPSEDLESPYETVRADNVQAIHAEGEAPAERMREPGGPLQTALQEHGFPNPRAVRAGFMPMVGPRGADFAQAEREGRTFQGPLGPRFELDDSKATYTKSRLGDTVKLPDVLDHPDLYRNYPELMDADFTREKRMPQGVTATYNPQLNWVRASASAPKGDIIHEIQHGIQKLEGAQMGAGSIQAQSRDLRSRFQQYTLAPELRHLFDQTNPSLTEEQFKAQEPGGDYEKYLNQRALMKNRAVDAALRQSVPFGRYWREPTEVEAREAEKRTDMTAAERAANPPTFDPGEPNQQFSEGIPERQRRFFQGATKFMPETSSTRPIMAGEEEVPQKRRTVSQVADMLTQRAKDAGMNGERTTGNKERIAAALADEAEHAVGQSGIDTGSGWYGPKVEEALQHVTKMHPEIATDPDAKRLFTALTAITSNGQRIQANADRAIHLYEGVKKTGRIETDGNWGGKTKDSINSGLSVLQSLIDKHGLSKTMDFLDSPMTVAEVNKSLKAHGIKPISGELADTPVKGAMIFGPKIGSFYGNLNGDFSTLTMDRWFMRTFNRHDATLTDINPDSAPGQAQRIVSALKGKRVDLEHALGPVREGLQAIAKEPPKSWNELPQPVQDYLTSRYKAYEDSGFKDKSEINKAAKNLYLNYKEINQAPENGGHRAWIREVANRAQEMLQNRGIHLSNADFQALLWYYEKDLYKRLGVNVKDRGEAGEEGESAADYAQAFRNIHERRTRATERSPAPAGGLRR